MLQVSNPEYLFDPLQQVRSPSVRYKYDKQFRISVQVNTMLYCISVMLKVSVYSLYRYYKNIFCGWGWLISHSKDCLQPKQKTTDYLNLLKFPPANSTISSSLKIWQPLFSPVFLYSLNRQGFPLCPIKLFLVY